MSKMTEIEIHNYPAGFDPNFPETEGGVTCGTFTIWIKLGSLGWVRSPERSAIKTMELIKKALEQTNE